MASKVERAIPDKIYSKQPRFLDPKQVFGSVFGWVQRADMEEKPYQANSMARDQWLRGFIRREPHLLGVMNSVISIDKNRGWSIVGGRNQVIRFTNVMHSAEHGAGWRYYLGRGAKGFYNADLGFIGETGRDGKDGPLRALYNVDSARCRLTGNWEEPLTYRARQGGEFNWAPGDFFRVTPMPSDEEALFGLGLCAVSRCLDLAKIMIAIYEHDQEKLGARAPKGLLLLQNIAESTWEEAMEAREDKLTAKQRDWYGGVAVLASEAAGGESMDAKLVALSQLPEGFDLEKFTNLLMYGYALAFGYDPSEFWPVQYGSLGRGTETEIQHRKATAKGEMDFTTGYQEALQEELPETLHFEFEQRDIGGEILDAELTERVVGWVTQAYETGLLQGQPLLTREQAISLLVEKGVVPEEWTAIEEDVEGTDVEDVDRWRKVQRQRALEMPRVRLAIEAFPEEPIIKYIYDPVKHPLGRELYLWDRAADAVARKSWRVIKRETGEVIYSEGGVTITEEDVNRAIQEGGKRVDPELAELFTAPEGTERSLWQRILGR